MRSMGRSDTVARLRRWPAASVLALSGILLAEAARGLDPRKAITQYAHQVWKTDQGLPQNSIQAILQTKDGYIWLGTERGLVRFDGVEFTVFDKGNTPGMRNSNTQALYQDRAGNALGGNLGRSPPLPRMGASRRPTRRATASEATGCSALMEDHEGALWIGTGGGGLNRLKDGKIRTYGDEGRPFQRPQIWSDRRRTRDGTLWFGTDGGGLNRFRDGRFTVYGKKEGVPSDFVQAVFVDSRGDVWVGTDGGGLARYRDGQFTVYTQKDGLADDTVECIQEDRDGNLWIGNQGGLSRMTDGKLTKFTPAEGLSDDTVLAIFEDREGSLWIGTVVGGLNRLKDGKFTAFTHKEGLVNDRVRTIFEDHDGSIWLGTRGGGVSRYRNGVFSAFGARDGLSGDFARSIYEDGAGKLWVGTWGDGLDVLEKNGRFRAFHRKDGLPSEIIRCMYRDREGNLWIGTDAGGLVRERDGKFTVYGARDGLLAATVLAILEDRDGNLWLGTEGGGLWRFSHGRFTSFTTKEGLSDDTVLSLYEDADGCLWIGTDGGGLNRFKDGKFSRFTRREGLFDDVQYAILEDGRGNLWMSCSRGIFRVRRAELEELADGKREAVVSQSFGRADGMRSAECSGFTQPAGWKTRDGRLWFPTIEGAVVIDPDRIRTNTLPPPVVVEQVLIDHRALPRADEAELEPGRGDLEFHYAGLSFVDPDRVHFRYMLEGFDREWVEAGSRRVAFYTNIPPGRYTFPRQGVEQRRRLERQRRARALFPAAAFSPDDVVLRALRDRARARRIRSGAHAGRAGQGARAGARADRGRAHAAARGGQLQAAAALRGRRADRDREPAPLRGDAGARMAARDARWAVAFARHDRHRLLQGLQRRARPPDRRPVPAARRRGDPRGPDAAGRPRRAVRRRRVRGGAAVNAFPRRRGRRRGPAPARREHGHAPPARALGDRDDQPRRGDRVAG